jgi:lauroyl/myristoyl acyltransferase
MTVANELKDALQREVGVLTGVREEIRLKAHLAKADARSELDRLEKIWERLEEEEQRVHVKGHAQEIEASVRALLEELKTGYQNVKRQLVG